MVVKRFDVYAVNVDPVVGPEARKTRPCVILSPDETNRFIDTVIVAPVSSKGHRYPTRIPCTVDGKKAQVILDQIRTVDKCAAGQAGWGGWTGPPRRPSWTCWPRCSAE